MYDIYKWNWNRKRADFIAQKNILIGGGVTQKTTFKNNLSILKYAYSITDINKNIVIDIKVINYAKFEYFIISIIFQVKKLNSTNCNYLWR